MPEREGGGGAKEEEMKSDRWPRGQMVPGPVGQGKNSVLF